jgi:nucleoid-associated protein YejK
VSSGISIKVPDCSEALRSPKAYGVLVAFRKYLKSDRLNYTEMHDIITVLNVPPYQKERLEKRIRKFKGDLNAL